jgi:hypothetical protein
MEVVSPGKRSRKARGATATDAARGRLWIKRKREMDLAGLKFCPASRSRPIRLSFG